MNFLRPAGEGQRVRAVDLDFTLVGHCAHLSSLIAHPFSLSLPLPPFDLRAGNALRKAAAPSAVTRVRESQRDFSRVNFAMCPRAVVDLAPFQPEPLQFRKVAKLVDALAGDSRVEQVELPQLGQSAQGRHSRVGHLRTAEIKFPQLPKGP